jgi:hypothetical protein
MMPPAPAVAEIVNVLIANEALIVWFAVTLLNVNVVCAPTELPSTTTFWTWKPELGVIVNVWLAPELTVTEPVGEIVPPAPADAAIVNVVVLAANEAAMVWFAVTLLNVNDVTVPCETPSTSTFAT